MKKSKISSCISLFLLLFATMAAACQQEKAIMDTAAPSASTSIFPNGIFNSDPALTPVDTAVAYLAKSSAFISITPAYFTNPQLLRQPIPKEDKDKLNAITYRVMKHVKLIDSQYVFSVKNGKEIGISEDIYEIQRSNFEQANDWIRSETKKGIKLDLMQVTDTYLENLLR